MSWHRRHLLKGAAALAASLSLPRAQSAPTTQQTITVLTAYQDDVLRQFEAAFEQAHSQYRLQFVWRMPHDTLPYLADGNTHGVDVLWMASPRTFFALKHKDLWRTLDLGKLTPPDRIGGTQLNDPEHQYLATEMAAYGMAVNMRALQSLGLPPPQDWPDLLDARYAGHIALPVPSRVGFASVLMDIVLQQWGWDQGWALLSELAGNATLVGNGANFITDEVSSGRAAIGISIDFFVNAAIANGAPLKLIYPRHNGINPGHVAIPRNAPHPEGAQAFARFVLSPAGQSLLLKPDIRKLPVHADTYSAAEHYRPFDAAARHELDYDNEAGMARLGLIAPVFDALITQEHARLTALWQGVHATEQRTGKPMTDVRQCLCTPPISAADADKPALQAQFKRLEGSATDKGDNATLLAWQLQCRQARDKAEDMLKKAQL